MDLKLAPDELPADSDSFSELVLICTDAISFYQLASDWLTEQRSISFMRSDHSREHVVGISFAENEAGLAVGQYSSKNAIEATPNFALLPVDSDPAEIDTAIEKRNERFDIEFNDQESAFMAPAAAFNELIFSYALAMKGFAQVQLKEHDGKKYLALTLVMLTDRGEPDWGENILIKIS